MIHNFITIEGNIRSFDSQTGKIEAKKKDDFQESFSVRYNGNFKFCTDKISMFTLEMTQNCNLRCSYCVFSGDYDGYRAHKKQKMTKQTIDMVADLMKTHVDTDASEITICFFGGEALLEWKAVKYAVGLFDVILGNKVRYSLSTNGVLLSPPVIDYVCKHDNFSVYITVDGDQAMHDAHRVCMNGKGTFDLIMKNLRYFKDLYPNEYSERVKFLATVYSWNGVRKLAEVWQTNDCLRDSLPIHISRIIPNFKKDINREYDNVETTRNFFSDAFEQLRNGEINIMTNEFLNMVSIVESRKISQVAPVQNISTCYNNLYSCFINAHGDLYPCEKFCTQYSIGNVTSGFDQDRMKELQERFVSIFNRYCSQCWAHKLCQLCLTGLNHTDEDFPKLCEMERDSMEVALGLYCDYVDWKYQTRKIDDLEII